MPVALFVYQKYLCGAESILRAKFLRPIKAKRENVLERNFEQKFLKKLSKVFR